MWSRVRISHGLLVIVMLLLVLDDYNFDDSVEI